jgi:23S rRNA (uracil1939-C5)-methyltransferase
MGRAAVVPPAGSFLQATRLGEETLAGLVTGACERAKRVADLFAGSGPFSLRLAEKAEVHAVEYDQGSMAALDKAFRATPGLRRISTEARDLFRRPLLTPELNAFEAVVLDPPRAGAEAQAKQLAVSKVPLVVSVSCDAATFARDAAILIAGGYRLERVTPVDQFKHSPHLEVVGILRKDAVKKRR